MNQRDTSGAHTCTWLPGYPSPFPLPYTTRRPQNKQKNIPYTVCDTEFETDPKNMLLLKIHNFYAIIMKLGQIVALISCSF